MHKICYDKFTDGGFDLWFCLVCKEHLLAYQLSANPIDSQERCLLMEAKGLLCITHKMWFNIYKCVSIMFETGEKSLIVTEKIKILSLVLTHCLQNCMAF